MKKTREKKKTMDQMTDLVWKVEGERGQAVPEFQSFQDTEGAEEALAHQVAEDRRC